MIDITKKVKIPSIMIISLTIVTLVTIPTTVTSILSIPNSLPSFSPHDNSVVQTSFSLDSSLPKITIGELISEGHGKIIGQRNIGSEKLQNIGTAMIEVSYLGTGNIKGIGNVSETWTFVNTHRPNAIIQGKGYGTIITEDDNEIANAIEYGRGKHIQFNSTDKSLDKIVYPGARFFFAETIGKMTFLNNIVGITEWEVDSSHGNYKYKMWELK